MGTLVDQSRTQSHRASAVPAVPPLPQRCPWSMRGDTLPSANPRQTLLPSLSQPSQSQPWQPRWISETPAAPVRGWSQQMSPDATSGSKFLLLWGCQGTASSWSWAVFGASPQLWCPLPLHRAAVVSTFSRSTISKVQISPENTISRGLELVILKAFSSLKDSMILFILPAVISNKTLVIDWHRSIETRVYFHSMEHRSFSMVNCLFNDCWATAALCQKVAQIAPDFCFHNFLTHQGHAVTQELKERGDQKEVLAPSLPSLDFSSLNHLEQVLFPLLQSSPHTSSHSSHGRSGTRVSVQLTVVK